MSSSSLRPEPAVVEAPLLQSAYNESAAPLAYVILMKSACRLRFVQRRDAAAMRCGCNAMAAAMRRCDGDATAMRPRRRRCNRAETGAETGAETSAACAQDRFKIDAEFRQNNDKIQTSYMQIQTCMYVLVSIPKMQTSYRLNRNAILFR